MIFKVVISNPTEWYKQPGSWLIRKVDKSSGSHVSVFLETYSGIKVYESIWPRSHKITHAEWSKHNEFIKEYTFPVPPESQADVYELLGKSVNKPYSIPQLILIAIDYIVAIDFTNINGGKWLICSEMAARPLVKFFGAKFGETLDTVGVSDIENECERLLK